MASIAQNEKGCKFISYRFVPFSIFTKVKFMPSYETNTRRILHWTRREYIPVCAGIYFLSMQAAITGRSGSMYVLQIQ